MIEIIKKGEIPNDNPSQIVKCWRCGSVLRLRRSDCTNNAKNTFDCPVCNAQIEVKDWYKKISKRDERLIKEYYDKARYEWEGEANVPPFSEEEIIKIFFGGDRKRYEETIRKRENF